MGYCYPGRNDRGGDRPPRPECAQTWLPRLLAHLSAIEFTILAGRYGQEQYLGARAKKTLTETVRAWREHWPMFMPLPHPSFRNLRWLKQNPWFTEELLPPLRQRIRELL